MRVLLPADAEYWPMQLVGLLGVARRHRPAARALRRARPRPPVGRAVGVVPAGVRPRRVTNSHIDIVGVLLVVVATAARRASGRRWRAGIALGAAIATKLIPVIAAPALLGGSPARGASSPRSRPSSSLYPVRAASAGSRCSAICRATSRRRATTRATASCCCPRSCPGSRLRRRRRPDRSRLPSSGGKTDPADPWLGQLVMIGVTLLVVTPRYPWYALLLVPMIAMTGRWEWLAVPARSPCGCCSPGAVRRSSGGGRDR